MYVNGTLSICPTLSSLLCQKSIVHICISIPALKIGSCRFLLLDSIYICYYMIFVFLFLTSLCMTDSGFIHITIYDPISFLFWLSNIPLYIYTTSLSIHLLIEKNIMETEGRETDFLRVIHTHFLLKVCTSGMFISHLQFCWSS